MENETYSTDGETDEEFFSVPTFEFYLLLIIQVIALILNLILIVYFIRFWNLLVSKALRNHVMLILICLSLLYMIFDLPFTINAYRLGYEYPRNEAFCRWWYWIDYTLLINSINLTAIASVQRHVLIFNAYWLNSTRLRWILHYLPILFCLIYPSIFYLFTILIYPCEYPDEDSTDYCSEPCYTENSFLFNYDWIVNTALPLLMIFFSNIALILRVTSSMKKTRRQQQLTWKRQRKLTLQLLALSSLYFFGWMPSTLMSIVQSLSLPNLLDEYPQLDYLNFLTYFVCPLQPFLCLLGLPELIKSTKDRCRQVIHRQVVIPLRVIPTNT